MAKNTTEKEKKKRSRTSRVVLAIILTICIGVFLIAGLKLLSITQKYRESAEVYKRYEEAYVKPPTDPEKDYPEIDVAALVAENAETKGYLYAKDVCSYPVVQGVDNEFYLHHMFNGEYNDGGCLFIDYRIPDGFDARNCIVYGHNMKDESMFGNLYKYFGDSEYYQNHRDYHVYTPDHHYLYRAFSVYQASVSGFTYQYQFGSDEDFLYFLDQTVAASIYPNDCELTADSKILTLSTCTWDSSEEYRNVVVLVRIKEFTD